MTFGSYRKFFIHEILNIAALYKFDYTPLLFYTKTNYTKLDKTYKKLQNSTKLLKIQLTTVMY